jgi:flagellar basal body-associated protein FliL
MDLLELDIPFSPAPHRRTERRDPAVRNRRLLIVAIIGTVLLILCIVAILCVYFLVIKHTQSELAVSPATQPTSTISSEYNLQSGELNRFLISIFVVIFWFKKLVFIVDLAL